MNVEMKYISGTIEHKRIGVWQMMMFLKPEIEYAGCISILKVNKNLKYISDVTSAMNESAEFKSFYFVKIKIIQETNIKEYDLNLRISELKITYDPS